MINNQSIIDNKNGFNYYEQNNNRFNRKPKKFTS